MPSVNMPAALFTQLCFRYSTSDLAQSGEYLINIAASLLGIFFAFYTWVLGEGEHLIKFDFEILAGRGDESSSKSNISNPCFIDPKPCHIGQLFVRILIDDRLVEERG